MTSCLLTSGSSPWWCRPKCVGRSSVGGIKVPAKSNRACMACQETTECVGSHIFSTQEKHFSGLNVEKTALNCMKTFFFSISIVRNISRPSWFLSFWVPASLSSTPASLAPAYSCGPIPSEASPVDPLLNSHTEKGKSKISSHV